MNVLSSSPWMIGSANNAFVAGELEVSPASAGPPASVEPDPGDTVRLPTLERSARMIPAAS